MPPPHEILQNGQAVLPLHHTPPKSQAAPTPALPVPAGDLDFPSVPVMPIQGGVDNRGEFVHGLPG